YASGSLMGLSIVHGTRSVARDRGFAHHHDHRPGTLATVMRQHLRAADEVAVAAQDLEVVNGARGIGEGEQGFDLGVGLLGAYQFACEELAGWDPAAFAGHDGVATGDA